MGRHHVKEHTRGDGTVVTAHERTSSRAATGQDTASADAAKAAAAAAAAAAAEHADGSGGGDDPPENYLGVRGGLPPDRESFAFWKASKWASQNEIAHPVGPVRLEDGRHAVAIYELDSSQDPRDDTGDLFTGLGTFAVMGDSEHSRSKFVPFGDEKFDDNRVDWWRHKRADDIQEAMPWMLREMREGPQSTDEYDDMWSEEEPSWDDMNGAALAYHQRTGDFAFPLYVQNRGQDLQMRIAQPAEGAAAPFLPGEPSGFAFLSRKQAESMDNEPTVEQAYGWMQHAVDVRNDWAAGSPTEGLVAYFDDDTGTDGPDDVIGTNTCKNDELDEAMRDTMASY